MGRRSISEDVLKARAERIRQCIDESGVKQNAIARFCDVTTQSVGGWKKTGRIEPENLYKLSEITKYRYLWLRDGTGSELITDSEENAKAYSEDFSNIGHFSIGPLSDYPEGDAFVAAINRFISQSSLKLNSLSCLTAFFNQMSGFEPEKERPKSSDDLGRSRLELTLIELSQWLKTVPDETRYAIGELLKSLSMSSSLSDQIIQSILLISKTTFEVENPIKAARLKQGWSSAYLAEQLGVSRQTLSSWESEESDVWPERDRWYKISDVLGVSLQEIASFSIHKIPKG